MNETLQELLKRLEQEWAPELLALAARIVFYDSLGWLLLGFVFLLLSGTIPYLMHRHWPWLTDDADDDARMFLIVTGGLMSGLFGLFALCILLNIWNWIGVFDPQLAVAKRIFDAVIARK